MKLLEMIFNSNFIASRFLRDYRLYLTHTSGNVTVMVLACSCLVNGLFIIQMSLFRALSEELISPLKVVDSF